MTFELLTGCAGMSERLDHLDKPPPMTTVSNPVERPDYKPLNWPMPNNPPPERQYANSLWQPGARAFFRDGRASRVGDILKVIINVNDTLQLNNQTEGKRTTVDQASAPSILGMGSKLFHFAPETQLNGNAGGTGMLNLSGNLDTKGLGTIMRQDIVTTQVAAQIIQVLPDGNFVIEGSQEITENQDVRDISVKGVIRPQDIKSDNTINSSQIAEARIEYTSRGQLSDMQKPRWGGQIIDAVSPF